MRTSILLIFLVAVAANVVVHAQPTPATEFWRRNLPEVPIPEAIAARASQLQGAELSNAISQVRSGRLSSSFCSRVRLACYFDCIILRRILCRPVGTYGLPCYWPCRETARRLAPEPQTFFTQDNLQAGRMIDVRDITDNKPGRDIAPKSLADTFPSLKRTELQRYLQLFNTSQESVLGSVILNTLTLCDDPNDRENGTCFKSLEELVSAGAPFGRLYYVADVAGPVFNATVTNVLPVPITNQGILVCHAQLFPFQVFFCHRFFSRQINVFQVSVDANGQLIDGLLAVCHLDISGWDPSFVSNGETNACHFISQNDMCWY